MKNTQRVRRLARLSSSSMHFKHESGVMIIPPEPGTEEHTRAAMQKVRQQLKDDLGEEEYNNRMKATNEWFENYTGIKVHSK
ncbi:hypothetical protein [Paenibacillus medicaginis]|uniref:Uncharacterized protein n=1 Tax=Paenibacillus medicaginis TaxID=1470560 RepID=A0ABV5C0A7_9BACL